MSEFNFKKWEDETFGFGYGTGEVYIIDSLKIFMGCLHEGKGYPGYKYDELENAMGPHAAWLLINALCRTNTIEYGTSPRFGWLTPEKGLGLKKHIEDNSPEELYEELMSEGDWEENV